MYFTQEFVLPSITRLDQSRGEAMALWERPLLRSVAYRDNKYSRIWDPDKIRPIHSPLIFERPAVKTCQCKVIKH